MLSPAREHLELVQVLLAPGNVTLGAVEAAAGEAGLLHRVSAVLEAAPLATNLLDVLDM